ncbi:hypothetical protein AKJ53_01910 [candidate division MSBL1 archaeon SCGC-AAA382F02]|uniref:L-threonylcarbamoyladenylate synthase n=1 Tax=candidate division MSBL1 archaeon SCGC-AAA382F02 TaxID=1698282 RepID=A0A133VHB1_9EURY|nr:hypothetical protein AKJ53_01910 [candidate division MSBL1 archaeon SCGC-AAA382F02]
MVEILSVKEEKPDSEKLERAAKVLKNGDLVIYPTETVYGIATDATSDEATAKVFKAKARPLEKPISAAVDSLSMSYYVGKVTSQEEILIEEFLPGPLTVLVEARPAVSEILSAGTGKIGIRIPDNSVALELIKTVGGPITSTSANVSGSPAPARLDEAIDQLEKHVELALDVGELPIGEPSTVVDVTGEDIRILREGPISKSDIRSVLK